MHQIDIPVDELGTFPVKGKLKVKFDLKNIEVARDIKRWEIDHPVGVVTLEVFNRRSFQAWLNVSKLGIVSPEKKRCVDVCACTLAHFWAEQWPDHRCWLCRRRENGTVAIGICLNNPRVLDSFGDLCNNKKEGCPWVSVFMEERARGEEFQPIEDETLLVFCKLWEAPNQDLSYHGHLLVKKTMPILELWPVVMATVPSLQDDDKFCLYLEKGISLEEIPCSLSALDEYGVVSGSVLIVKTWQVGGDHSAEFVRQLLVASDEESGSDPDSEASTCSEEEPLAGQGTTGGAQIAG